MVVPALYLYPNFADRTQLANTSNIPSDIFRVYVLFEDVDNRDAGGGTWMKRYANTPDPVTSQFTQDSDNNWWIIDSVEVDDRTEITIPSNTSIGIGNINYMYAVVTGNTTISSFDNTPNRIRFLRFANNITLVHNISSMSLYGSNIVTADGDSATFVSSNTGVWQLTQYNRKAWSTSPTIPLEDTENTWTKTQNHANGIHFGTTTAANTHDLSRHIALFGSKYGFNVTGGALNYVSDTNHRFRLEDGTLLATLNSSGLDLQTVLALASGGTGASTALAAANNIGIKIESITPTITFDTPGDLNVTYHNQDGYFFTFNNQIAIFVMGINFTPTHTTSAGNFRILPNSSYSISAPSLGYGIFRTQGGSTIPTFPSGAHTTFTYVTNTTALGVAGQGSGVSSIFNTGHISSNTEYYFYTMGVTEIT